MEKTDLLFVYGTLRHGAALTADAERGLAERLRGLFIPLGLARLRGWLYRVADYPALVPDDAGGWVTGELVRLRDPAQALALLDAYEECSEDFPVPHEYRREVLAVEGQDGPALAWVYAYVLPVDGLTPVPGGDWLA